MSDVDAELAEIRQVLETDSRSYWRSPEMQARHQALHEAKESGGAPSRPSQNEARLTEIRNTIRDDAKRYWNSPEMQKEHGELLAGKSGGSSAPGYMAEVAEALGISEEAAADMQSRITDAFAGVDSSELDTAFEGLSDNIQRAWFAAAAEPHRMEEFLDMLSDDETIEAAHFVKSLTPEELRAVERVLLL